MVYPGKKDSKRLYICFGGGNKLDSVLWPNATKFGGLGKNCVCVCTHASAACMCLLINVLIFYWFHQMQLMRINSDSFFSPFNISSKMLRSKSSI